MPPSSHANAANDAHAPLTLEPALEMLGSAISFGLQLPAASGAGAGVATAVSQPAGATPHLHPEAPNARRRSSLRGRFGDRVDGVVRAVAFAGVNLDLCQQGPSCGSLLSKSDIRWTPASFERGIVSGRS